MTPFILLAIVVLLALLGLGTAWRRRARVAGQAVTGSTPQELEPRWVAGFSLPGRLHYQRGHVWARLVAPDTAEVGLDDFAARLLGDAARVDLPALGSRVAQGARAARVRAGAGRSADLVSPVNGEVVAVNPLLASQPKLAVREPYGRGWLVRVRCDDADRDLRNLLCGRLAETWMEDSRDELELAIEDSQSWHCRDGGDLAPGYGARLDHATWRRLTRQSFLT